MVALALAMGMMVVILGLLLTYTTTLVVQQRQTEQAWAAAQAYYAAEAGLAVARQTGHAAAGPCGQGRYRATVQGGQVSAIGEVETAGGHVVQRRLSYPALADSGTPPAHADVGLAGGAKSGTAGQGVKP
jgi:hypothetical protein